MTRLVAIAITCCPDCSTSYDIDEWRALQLRREYHKEDPAMTFEVRECLCGRDVKTRVDGLDEMELHISADVYAEAYGPVRDGKAFGPQPSWFDSWRDTLTLLCLVIVAFLIVALLALGLVRAIL